MRPVLAVLAVLTLGACAPSAPLVLPAELPLRTVDQGYRMQWALERGPERVRAAGLVSTSGFQVQQITLVLYGLDQAGRIASRGYAYVRQPFDIQPAPFEALLTPSGREARFELRVWEQWHPGLQGLGR